MLKIENVKVVYGPNQAVRGVSIHVQAGEIITIIGANGAGKSTLMRAIAGLERVAEGVIRFENSEITTLQPYLRTQLGLVLSPEGRGVFPDQSVLDNLLLGAYTVRKREDAVRTAMERNFALFPILRERREQLAGTLSGGEQQMLAIARALMSQPKLLLLDEPSLGLAPLITMEIFRAIRRLRDEGLTVLLVEQMANQALAVCDRGYVLELGSIVLEGPGNDLLRNPRVKAAYLGG